MDFIWNDNNTIRMISLRTTISITSTNTTTTTILYTRAMNGTLGLEWDGNTGLYGLGLEWGMRIWDGT